MRICLLFVFFFLMIRRPPRSTRTDTLFPDTTLFRSSRGTARADSVPPVRRAAGAAEGRCFCALRQRLGAATRWVNHPHFVGAERQITPSERMASATRTKPAMLAPRTSLPGALYQSRSDVRRVGKESVRTCRSRWAPYHEKKQT